MATRGLLFFGGYDPLRLNWNAAKWHAHYVDNPLIARVLEANEILSPQLLLDMSEADLQRLTVGGNFVRFMKPVRELRRQLHDG